MSDLAPRLAASISSLIERFKVKADGPYADLGLVETAIIGRIAMAECPLIQGELAHLLELPKTTMASAVSRLQRRGLLTREPADDDRRARVLVLTPSGSELAASLRQTQLAGSTAMLGALDADEQRQLIEALEKIAAADLSA